MRLRGLREEVWRANLKLREWRLSVLTWGNVSGYDPNAALVAIKPSGVSFEQLRPEDIVLVDLEGKVVEGQLNPSSDTPTHLELYLSFPEIRGVCHSHSLFATIFAQAEKEIPCMGTTQADYFFGSVPLARRLKAEEIVENYEKNTGKAIVETLAGKDIMSIPGILLPGHGVFTWGESPSKAVEIALVVEEVAKMALGTFILEPGKSPLPEELLAKHYRRRHGKDAYYGQKKGGQNE